MSTPERILYAAAARIVAGGTANLSMQDVADAAGVSKGLIHYHFHDKETLLTRLIEWMTHESIDREAATLAAVHPRRRSTISGLGWLAKSIVATFVCSTSSRRNGGH